MDGNISPCICTNCVCVAALIQVHSACWMLSEHSCGVMWCSEEHLLCLLIVNSTVIMSTYKYLLFFESSNMQFVGNGLKLHLYHVWAVILQCCCMMWMCTAWHSCNGIACAERNGSLSAAAISLIRWADHSEVVGGPQGPSQRGRCICYLLSAYCVHLFSRYLFYSAIVT